MRIVIIYICCGFLSPALSITGREIIEATGIKSGLCITVGATDGVLESELTDNQTMLVQGLTTGQAALETARTAIRGRDLYGMASVRLVRSYAALPFAENMVNLLVADLDELGDKAPSRDEITRVLVPGGTSYVRASGQWSSIIKPAPEGMDGWTHYDHSAERNPVSSDQLVGPIASMKWTTWYRNNAAGQRHGIRTVKGMVAHEAKTKGGFGALYGRDAFNGLPRWMLHSRNQGAYQAMFTTLSSDQHIFTAYSLDGSDEEPLKAFDPLTGDIVRTYTNGGRTEKREVQSHWWPRMLHAVYSSGVIYQSGKNRVYALSEANGELLWDHTEPGVGRLFYPVYAASEGMVFLAGCTENYYCCPQWGAELINIVALNSQNGKVEWRNTQVAGKAAGQLFYYHGHLIFFTAGNPSRRTTPNGNNWTHVGVLRAADGELLWSKNHQRDDNPAQRVNAFMALGRDNSVYLLGAEKSGVARYHLTSGQLLSSWVPQLPAQMCIKARSTAKYLFPGMAVLVDQDSKYKFQPLAWNSSSIGVFPANGMQYLYPDGCQCQTRNQSMSAYSSVSAGPALPDVHRLQLPSKRSSRPSAAIAAGETGEEGMLVKTAAIAQYDREPVITPSPIRDEWRNNDVLPYPETQSVSAGGKTFVAVVNEHRMECRQSGAGAVWSYVAGGRITGPPVIEDGLCIFGSHDGRVYCLKADDGSLVWSFLAAWNERQMTAWGQLESAWPVYGVVMHGGKVCFSAGRDLELEGGVIAWGLEPATGKIAWKASLAHQREWCPESGACYVNAPGRVTNDALQASGGVLTLPGVTIDPDDYKYVAVSFEAAPQLDEGRVPALFIGRGFVQADFGTEVPKWVELNLKDVSGKNIFSSVLPGKPMCVFSLPRLEAKAYIVTVMGEKHQTSRRLISIHR